MASDSTGSVAFVAVPFPAQGHLNQLLHLSLLVASRGLSVHYAAPAAHVRQARSRLDGRDSDALGSIHFHDLDVSAYESPAPDPTAPSPFPNHLLPMWEAFAVTASAPLAILLQSLSATHRRVVVMYDRVNSFAAVEAARLGNGEAYGLQCVAISYQVGLLDAAHQLLRDNGLHYVPMDVTMSKEFLEYLFRTMAEVWEATGIVMNTCRALEGEFIDAIAELPGFNDKKLFAVGPLNPLLDASARTPGKMRHQCMDWLDAQPPASVLYVSFGTTSSFREEQIAEMAAALKGSKQRYIWVLRDADRADIFAESGGNRRSHKVMSDFTKETEGIGLVITGWAPQLEILAHGATAAFMSHCGWNSTLESLSHGKPILAWPMHSDQPWDAELLCKYFKVALLVRPWEKHGEVIPADAIQEVIEEAMLSENGMEMRQRAKVLGEAVRASVKQGGTSSQDLDRFVAYITSNFEKSLCDFAYSLLPRISFGTMAEVWDATWVVMNTCRALEGEFINAIAELQGFNDKKLFAVGPLNPLLDATARTPGKTRHGCMDWLDVQPPASVLYVSFGTTSSFQEEQIAEMAAALKGSKQRFIWVLRDADRADIFAESGRSRSHQVMSAFTKETEGI